VFWRHFQQYHGDQFKWKKTEYIMATSFSGGRSRSSINWFDLIWFLVINDTFSLFQLYHGDQLSGGRSRSNRFSYIMATSFSGGRSRSTRRESSAISWRPVLVVEEAGVPGKIMATSFSGGRSRSTRREPVPVLVVEEAGVPGENHLMATSFSGGRSRSTRREPQIDLIYCV